MRKSWKILITVIVILALLVSIPVFMHFRAKQRLADYKQQLIAAGGKLTVAELMPKRPEGKNGAKDFRATPALSGLALSSMRIILPGKAEVTWRQVEVRDDAEIYYKRGVTNFWPVLRDQMAQNSAAEAELRASLQQPAFYLTADCSEQGLNLMLPHLISLKQVEQEFCTAALLNLHYGETSNAHANILAAITLPRVFRDEPLIMSQLVRFACITLAFQATWEALQSDGWTDEQLAAWQREWDAIEITPEAVAALALDRALEPILFKSARSSVQALKNSMSANYDGPLPMKEIGEAILKDPVAGWQAFLKNSYPRFLAWKWIWSYDDERQMMDYLQEGINNFKTDKRITLSALNEVEKDVAPRFFISLGERASILRFVWKARRVKTLAQMAVAAITLQRHHLLHHEYPKALQELAPKFIQAVPVDYMDGKELRYRLKSDGNFLLYSVGDNGQDDGGDPNPPKGGRALLLNGQDWVWPQSATPEEVKAYEEQEMQKRKR